MQTPQIFIERICRALISMIPIAGSPLEQLTFGIKDSFDNKALLQKLSALENVIKVLIEKGLNTDSIMNEVRQSIEFIETEVLLSKSDKAELHREVQLHSSNIDKQLMMSSLIKNSIEENNKRVKMIEEKIEELEEGRHEFLIKLNKVLLMIEQLKTSFKKENKLVKADNASLQVIKEEARNLGLACKIALKAPGILMTPAILAEYAGFPFSIQSKDSLYIQYIFSDECLECFILDADLDEYKALINHFYKYKEPGRFVQGASEYTKHDKLITLLKKHTKNKVLKSAVDNPDHGNKEAMDLLEKLDLISTRDGEERFNKVKQWLVSLRRFQFLDKFNGDNNFSLLLPDLSKRDRQIHDALYKNEVIKNLEKETRFLKVNVIALSVFLRTKHNPALDIRIFHELFDAIKENLNNEYMAFQNVADMQSFADNMQVLYSRLDKFKEHVKKQAISELANLRKQQIICNESFIDFFNAYGEIESTIKKALLNENLNLDFDNE